MKSDAGPYWGNSGGMSDLQTDYYIASTASNKVHACWCEWALQIDVSNRRRFISVPEAIEAGHKPATCCIEFTHANRRTADWRMS